MSERTVLTKDDLDAVLKRIDVRAPFDDWKWQFHSAVTEGGWLVWASFWRADAVSGSMGNGRSRGELVPAGSTESTVVKTAFLLLEVTIKHEIMEAFHIDHVRLFDPHLSLEQLKTGRTPKQNPAVTVFMHVSGAHPNEQTIHEMVSKATHDIAAQAGG